MKAQFLVLAALASTLGYAYAQNEVYVCSNGNGTREYKNTGDTAGCKKVDLQGVTMIPAPASANRKPASQAAARAVATPVDFPRIDSGTQKARDNDRMQILVDELRSEDKKLAALKEEYKNGEPDRHGNERNYAKYQERVTSMKEDLSRTERNIEALKREISNLK